MVRELLAQMLGGYGNALLVLITSNPVLLAAVLTGWFAVMLAGNIQLRRIERESVRYVRRESERLIAANPQISAHQLCDALYPAWAQEMRRWAWYVPHRWELWPVPVRVETVQRHFQFSAAWLREVLRTQDHGKRKGLNEHNVAAQ